MMVTFTSRSPISIRPKNECAAMQKQLKPPFLHRRSLNISCIANRRLGGERAPNSALFVHRLLYDLSGTRILKFKRPFG